MIVSLTAYNRPEYLAAVMESFHAADRCIAEPVALVATVDPSDKLDEVLELLPAGRGCYVSVNSWRLGLQANTLRALNEAWRVARVWREDFVLHLEDDLVLAPDALEFACWARDKYRDSDEVGFIGLTECHNVPTPEEYYRVRRFNWFECHAWGTWESVWSGYLEPNWPHEWVDHWAARVNDRGMFGYEQVLPLLSRSKSIGVYGQHCNPEYHARHNPRVFAGDVVLSGEDYFSE